MIRTQRDATRVEQLLGSADSRELIGSFLCGELRRELDRFRGQRAVHLAPGIRGKTASLILVDDVGGGP